MHVKFNTLKDKGIFLPDSFKDYQVEKSKTSFRNTWDGVVCDAQPQLVTSSNAGVPAYLSTFLDPQLIRMVFYPLKAEEIAGETIQKGDWTTSSAAFTQVESTGEVVSYGDFNEAGLSGVNISQEFRQPYNYQTMVVYGEKEEETSSLYRVALSNEKRQAAAMTLNRFQNKSWFFGVDGIECYGLLNDPNLNPPIHPTVKAAGGTTWAKGTALEIIADVKHLYKQAAIQTGYNIQLDTEMILAMSSLSEAELTKVTEFNVNSAMDTIRKTYPNLTVKTAPEYSTPSGELVQLYANSYDGVKTAIVAYNVKMRVHNIVQQSSSWKQKISQGTFGAIIRRPAFVAQMIGV